MSSGSAPAAPAAPRPRKAKYVKGQVIKSREDRETASGVVVKEWQRLPKQLVNEFCQREKRPRPNFSSLAGDGGRWRGRAILPDSRGVEEKKLIFYTAEAFENAQLAEEFSAILVLFHFNPAVQYNLKFPEPFASAWKSLSTDSPIVSQSNRFTSSAERGQAELERKRVENEKSSAKEDKDRHLPNLFLSEENRQAIEELINGEIISNSEEENRSNEEMTISDAQSSQKLRSLGFADYAIRLAENSISSNNYSRLLDWLCVNLPESELPARFDPRGKQLESHFAGSNRRSVRVLEFLSPLLGSEFGGIPKKILIEKIERNEEILKENSTDEKMAAAVAGELIKDFYPAETIDGGRDESLIDEELTALESIFGSDFSLLETSAASISNLRSWKISLKLDSPFHTNELKCEIHFIILPSSNYPNEPPLISLHSIGDQLAPSLRLILVQFCYSFIQSAQLLGSPITFSLIDALTASARSTLESARRIFPDAWRPKKIENFSDGGDEKISSTRKEKSRRPIDQMAKIDFSSFRSQFDSLSLASPLAEFRRSLPIAAFEQAILDAFEKNSVIIIEAATGSGKYFYTEKSIFSFYFISY